METDQTSRGDFPPPQPLAMVVCDSIHHDPGSDKASILGCFSVIGSREFPAIHPVMCLYVSITDGRGRVDVRVQLIDVDETREPVWEESRTVDFTDPRMVIEISYVVPCAEFPEPGEYRFQMFANDDFLMERRILVVAVDGDSENEPNGN